MMTMKTMLKILYMHAVQCNAMKNADRGKEHTEPVTKRISCFFFCTFVAGSFAIVVCKHKSLTKERVSLTIYLLLYLEPKNPKRAYTHISTKRKENFTERKPLMPLLQQQLSSGMCVCS